MPSTPVERLGYFVAGTPIPQGSKRAWYSEKAKRVYMTEDAGKRHATWRWELAGAARQAMADANLIRPFFEPVYVRLDFYQHRPVIHYGTGKNADKVKPSAPLFPHGKPDIDKLVRAVFDSLTSIVWVDDAQAVRLTATKNYVERWESEGVKVSIATYEREEDGLE